MVNNWHLIGKVNASSYRKKILESLSKEPKTPTILEKELDIKFSHISRALKELEDMKLIKCLTPELRKNKFYGITELGKEILEKL